MELKWVLFFDVDVTKRLMNSRFHRSGWSLKFSFVSQWQSGTITLLSFELGSSELILLIWRAKLLNLKCLFCILFQVKLRSGLWNEFWAVFHVQKLSKFVEKSNDFLEFYMEVFDVCIESIPQLLFFHATRVMKHKCYTRVMKTQMFSRLPLQGSTSSEFRYSKGHNVLQIFTHEVCAQIQFCWGSLLSKRSLKNW